MSEPVGPSVGLGVVHLFCTGDAAGRGRRHRRRRREGPGRRRPGRHRGRARPQGRPGLHGPRHRPVAPARASRPALQRGRARRGRLLRVADRAVASTPRACPSRCARPASTPMLPPEGKPAWCFYPMSKKRERRRQLVHPALRRAQGAHVRARRIGPHVRRSGRSRSSPARPASTTTSGASRCSPPPRRPQGGRLHDALRHRLGRVRRVRPLLHRHGGAGRRGARPVSVSTDVRWRRPG